MKEKRMFYNDADSGKMFLACLIAPFALALLFSMIAGQIADARGVKVDVITSGLTYNLIYSFCCCALYFLIFFLYNLISNVSFKAINLKFKMSWKTYLLLIVIGIVALFGINYFIGATNNFLGVIGYPVKEGLPLVNPTSWPLFLLAILVSAVIPAICEELLFRGVILNGLRSRFSDVGSVVLSGLMFALMHGNLQQFIYPFILGCIMGWIVLRTGSLVSSIIVHFVNNFLVVTLAFIQNMTGFSLNLPNVWWFYLLAFGLLFITFAIIWLIDKYYFKRKTANNQERTSQKTSIYVYLSVAIAGVLLLMNSILAIVSKTAA